MKTKIMLGTSDAWLMSRSSHRPIDPAYYIEDCRILKSFPWILKPNVTDVVKTCPRRRSLSMEAACLIQFALSTQGHVQ